MANTSIASTSNQIGLDQKVNSMTNKHTVTTYEAEDMFVRQHDVYAHTKYEILMGWLKTITPTPTHILNAGCGSGEFTLILAQLGCTVVGFDPVPEYIDYAQQQAAKTGLTNCHFMVATIEDFVQKPLTEQYDCIFATDVIEHIEDDLGAVKCLISLLKPGGNLFIVVPGGPYLFGFHDEQLGHYRRYSLRQLRQTLPDNLEILKLRYFGFSLIPVAWLYSRMWHTAYPVAQTGDKEKNPVLASLVKVVLLGEKRLHPPLGTSCLLWARKKLE